MELPNKNTPVTIVNGGAQSSFSIAMNAKAFRVLSDTLYQDKIGSIVREISCNAYDSHISAGKVDTPFEIHMPDSFEPWFSVRDFGVGLSEESIVDIFTVYFQSTKDQSNDAVGAFGLGAKTPFSYTDQFNVTSTFNGVRYAYSAFINSGGMPEIMLMGSSETDDENGVEIRIPVVNADFSKFRDAVKRQLCFFEHKPRILNFVGEMGYLNQNVTIMFETKSCKIYTPENTGYGRKTFYAVQGPVGYPLDVDQAIQNMSAELKDFVRALTNLGGHVNFAIGEIGVTASREGIEYNEHTLKSMESRFKIIHDEIKDWFETKMKGCKNLYEKCVFINTNSELASVVKTLNFDLAPATSSYGSWKFDISDMDDFYKDVKGKGYNGQDITTKVAKYSFMEYVSTGSSGFNGSRHKSSGYNFIPSKNDAGRICFLIRDTARAPIARMRHFFTSKGYNRMIVISPAFDDSDVSGTLVKKLMKHLGGFDDVRLASTLPEAPKNVYGRVKGSYTRPTAYTVPKHNFPSLSSSVKDWERVYDSLDDLDTDKAFYVRVDRQSIEGYYSGPASLYQAFNLLESDGRLNAPIYGIREKDVEKLAETDTEWVELFPWMKEQMEEMANDPRIMIYARNLAINEHIKGQFRAYATGDLTVPDGTILKRVIDLKSKCQEYIDKNQDVEAVSRIFSNARATNSFEKTNAVIEQMALKFFKELPLLPVNQYYDFERSKKKHVEEYIAKFATRR